MVGGVLRIGSSVGVIVGVKIGSGVVVDVRVEVKLKRVMGSMSLFQLGKSVGLETAMLLVRRQ